MQGTFTDIVPVAEIRGGIVQITIGSNHPCVCTPVHVAREFCEVTIRKLDVWDAEQGGRVVAFRGGG